MKTVLLTLSTINSLAGLFLIGLFFAFSDSPAAPLLIGIGMLAQGAYTTIYLTKQLNRFEPYARRLLLVGQTISLVIGLGGGAIAFVSNINPPNGDYEYGPMSMFGLIALQAFAAMLYSTLNDLESSAKV